MFQDVELAYRLKPLAWIKAATTKWLSHLTACTRLSYKFVQVLDILDNIYHEKRDPQIYGIRAGFLQKSVSTVVLLHVCDVLKPMHILSQYLQGTDVKSKCKN